MTLTRVGRDPVVSLLKAIKYFANDNTLIKLLPTLNSLQGDLLLNSPCYGLTGLRVDAELVQDLGQDVRQLLREVVEGLELEDQWHHGVPRDRLTSQDNRIN